MPGFPPIASPPNARGLGSPAPVPPIRDAIDAALQKLPMRGTFQVVARNNTWTVRLSDHRDAAQVNAALKPIEAQMGVRVKVDVVGEAVANSATQR
jgi:maltose-binding protein MalE